MAGGRGPVEYEVAVPAVVPPVDRAAVVVPVVLIAEPLPVPPPAPAPGPAPRHRQRGVASWFDAPKATCAHRTIPKGTIVTVVRVDDGATTTCRVADRGPSDQSRVIDLSRDTFAKLAGTEKGLIQVQLRW